MPSGFEFLVISVADSLFLLINDRRTVGSEAPICSGSPHQTFERCSNSSAAWHSHLRKGEFGLAFAAKERTNPKRADRLLVATRLGRGCFSLWPFANKGALWRYAIVAAICKPHKRIQDVRAGNDAHQLFAAKDGNRADARMSHDLGSVKESAVAPEGDRWSAHHGLDPLLSHR